MLNNVFQGDHAALVGRALVKLIRHYRLNEDTVRGVWHLAGEKHFTAGAGPSNICSNGIPLEMSVSIGLRPSGLRYLSELGQGRKGWERLDDSRKKIPRLLNTLGLPLNPLIGLIDELIPETPERFPTLRFGMWVSPVFLQNNNQLKVYINTGWMHANDVWRKVFYLLELLKRSEAQRRLKRLLPELIKFHRLSFIGMENTIDGMGRLKLYFRGTVLTCEWIKCISRLAGDKDKLLSELWQAFFTNRQIGCEDGVVSVSLSQDNRPLSIKVDVAAKQLGLPQKDIPSLIKMIASAVGFDPVDYLSTLDAFNEVGGLSLQHSVIGISTAGNRPRINIYLRPVFRSPRRGSVPSY